MIGIGLSLVGIFVSSRFVPENFRFAYLIGALVILALGLTTNEFFRGVSK